ncbi:shikimate kinase [Thioclava sp. SK-1]|uniref:shikimate kinase n=1 Tax=Thioclava sp. SK-1 TaxID=1889770 RepID=UPI00114CDF3D|nr:shikimate kinase [Thioclava sp. SK-1]
MRQAQGAHCRLARTVVLVGMMGSGKTSVGTALARKLNVPFLDSDEEIERAAQMSVAEIFERDGESFFRARESEVLSRLLTGPPAIVSTGGGAFLAANNREMIARQGVSIWLEADVDILWNRVKGKTNRPLLRSPNPRATLERILSERVAIYRQAQLKVTAQSGFSVDVMAAKVIEYMCATPGICEEE